MFSKGLSTPQPGAKYGKKGDIGDDIVRLAASGIGLFSEIRYHRRERKQQAKSASLDTNRGQEEPDSPEPPTNQNVQASSFNDAVWKLDDASQEPVSQTVEPEMKAEKESKDLAKAFLRRHPLNSASTSAGATLELPVLLTQRRPKTRRRGFVRAYAPVLGDAGIDEVTFLDFVDSLNESMVPNPWLNAINLAGLATNAIPDPLINTVVGGAIDLTAAVTMELDSRIKSNVFLDVINEGFFRPRGLLCLIVTWQPNATESNNALQASPPAVDTNPTDNMGLNQMIKALLSQQASGDGPQKQLAAKMQHKFTPSSRSFDWLHPAPLVFPPSSEKSPFEFKARKAGETGERKKKNKFDRAEIWVDHFSDKRAQVRWINKESQHKPTVELPPAPTFQSRYADPNHPAASGDLLALVTGGKYVYRKPQNESMRQDTASSSRVTEYEYGSQQATGLNRGGHALAETVDLDAGGELSKEQRKKAAKREAEEARKRKKEEKAENTKQEKFDKKMAKNDAARNSWSGIVESTLQQDVVYLLIINDVAATPKASEEA